MDLQGMGEISIKYHTLVIDKEYELQIQGELEKIYDDFVSNKDLTKIHYITFKSDVTLKKRFLNNLTKKYNVEIKKNQKNFVIKYNLEVKDENLIFSNDPKTKTRNGWVSRICTSKYHTSCRCRGKGFVRFQFSEKFIQ